MNRRGFLQALGLTGAAAVTPAVVRKAVEERNDDVGAPPGAGLPHRVDDYAPGKTCVCGGTDFSIGRVDDDYEQAVCDLCTLELAQVHAEMEERRERREADAWLSERLGMDSRGVPTGRTLRHLPVRDIGTGDDALEIMEQQWQWMNGGRT